jgi:MFS family permease
MNFLLSIENREKSLARGLMMVFAISLIGGFLLFYAIQRNYTGEILISNDSKFYHIMAVNLLEGLPFHDSLQQDVEQYDPFTQNLLKQAGSLPSEAGPFRVTPVYPLFLATVYSAFGVSGEVVLRSQMLLTWVVGVMMVMSGYLLWGRWGQVIALTAILILGNLPDFGYSFYGLLTEGLATALCLATFLLAVWAKRGKSLWREGVVGIGMMVMILTKPAFLFCGAAYAGILLFPLSKRNVTRSMLFALPVALGLSVWSFQAWKISDEVPFIDHAVTAIKLGLRGESGVQRARMAAEGQQLDDIADRDLKEEITGFLNSPDKTLQIVRGKFENTLERVPRFFWALACLGFSIFVSGLLGRQSELRCGSGHVFWVLSGAAFLCILVGLGWSSPFIQALLLALPVAAAALSLRTHSVGTKRRNEAAKGFENWWALAWYIGFVAIPLLTIGLPRYFRPFMPVFALFAVFALPSLFALKKSARIEYPLSDEKL